RHVTGQPIRYIGTGEKTDALELFHPDRIASRILGMGDVLSLVEQVTAKVDQQKAEKLAAKLQQGKDFDLTDLKEQLQQLQQMGGLAAFMEKLPTQLAGQTPPGMGDDRMVRRQIAMIDSMTPRERRRPGIIDGSRRRRIAAGAGVQVQDVNRLLKQFLEMQKMMKKLQGGGIKKLLRGLGGRLPPGLRPPGGGGFRPG
ncbi:MAG: signal recognition particle protein, partial [Rhodospirillaceae bacterium]